MEKSNVNHNAITNETTTAGVAEYAESGARCAGRAGAPGAEGARSVEEALGSCARVELGAVGKVVARRVKRYYQTNMTAWKIKLITVGKGPPMEVR